jgi:hypothetical protein
MRSHLADSVAAAGRGIKSFNQEIQQELRSMG